MTAVDASARTVRTGDASFSYQDAGSGLPLVLLHGIGSAATSFRYQLQGLSTRFRVVAWDAPGYGASTPLAIEPPSASDYAAALDAWLRALDIDRCHLVGQSLGTLIAARCGAATAGSQPHTRRHRQRARAPSAIRATAASGTASR